MSARNKPEIVKFIPLVRDLLAWLKAAKVSGAIIGGLAVSMNGYPRMTQDVDLLVWLPEEDLGSFAAGGEAHGFAFRIEDAPEFAARSRVLLMKHRGSGVDLDIILGALPFEKEAIQNARQLKLLDVQVPVVGTEAILVMKLIAGRPRDIADAQGLLETVGKRLDKVWVRARLLEFAEALENDEALKRFDILCQRLSAGPEE